MGKNKQEKAIMPSSAGIITTYKCTAECEDCCFNCSRKNFHNEYTTVDSYY